MMDDLSTTDFTLHILNEKNKIITEDFINSLFKKFKIKHRVKNLEMYQRAMFHISYLKKNVLTDKTAKLLKDIPPIADSSGVMPLQDKSYERLEFLGDAVIHHVIAEYLYNRYDDKDEGFLTKLRTKIENKKTLAYLSRRLGLNEYAVFARNIELSGGRMNNISIMEDIFEAFIGALSKEATYELCREFIINIMEKELDIAELINTENNYKEMLMQYFHTMKWPDPIYSTDEIIGEGTRRKFKMAVKKVNCVIGTGIGTSKKEGEQNAARMALITYGVLTVNHNTEIENEDDDLYGELSDDEGSCNSQKNTDNLSEISEIYGSCSDDD